MRMNLLKQLNTFHSAFLKRPNYFLSPTGRHYSHLNMCHSFTRREWAIVEELRQIFAVQFSTQVFQELRRTEELYKDPIPPGEQKFTVMSYNVLAQDLIEIHRGIYPTQDPNDLKWENRKELLMNEIVSQSPDILAMQEVQQSHIPLFYRDLEKIGYKGVFKKRTGDNTDGVAVYYKTNVFDLLYWTSVEFNQPGIKILNRPNVGLILRLKLKNAPGEVFLANTHLLYNPKRSDVRLAQTQILLTELHRVTKMTANSSPALLFMGDLNSMPGSPAVSLLASGRLRSDPVLPRELGILNNSTHMEKSMLFNSDHIFSTQKVEDDKECRAESPSYYKKTPPNGYNGNSSFRPDMLSHNFNFSSVYDLSLSRRNRGATTYHDEWVTVDYMFYSNLRLLSRLRLPTVEECNSFMSPMPNKISPSDHFPLLATFAIL